MYFRIDSLILSKNTALYNYIAQNRQYYIKKHFWNVQRSVLISAQILFCEQNSVL